MPQCDILFAMTGNLARNSRAIRQVRALADAGYSVQVVSLEGDPSSSGLPGEVVQHTVPLPPHRGLRFFRAIHRSFSEKTATIDAALYHASDLYVLTACARQARIRGAALTYDSRELYTHVASLKGRPWARWAWQVVEGASIRKADRVITVSESIAARLSREYGIDRPRVFYNAPPLEPESDTLTGTGLRTLLAERDSGLALVAHLGQMRRDRGCEQLVRAMTRVPNAHLVFLGYGPLEASLRALAAQLDLSSRISFLHPIPPAAIRDALQDAQVGVTLLQDSCLNHRFALPNKLFDYLAAGIPVVGSDLPEIRHLLHSHGCGVVVDGASPESIARGLQQVLTSDEASSLSRGARKAAAAYDWSDSAPRFVSLFRELLDAQ